MKFILVYITNPSRGEAKKAARALLEKKLIACANIFPIESIYRWEGHIREGKEFALIAKTTEKNFEKVRKEAERIHPYEVPCIARIPCSLNKKFAEWLEEEVK